MSAMTCLLQHVDDDVGIDRSAGCAHGCPIDLMKDRAVELEIAVRHHECEQRHDEIGSSVGTLLFDEESADESQTEFRVDVGVEGGDVGSDEDASSSG